MGQLRTRLPLFSNSQDVWALFAALAVTKRLLLIAMQAKINSRKSVYKQSLNVAKQVF